MRMAELSRASGVGVATIKYYLRQGLLPPGERTGRNQARYGDEHVHRLKLIRSLLVAGGLSVNAVREVLKAMDSDEVEVHKVFGVAQAAITRHGLGAEDGEDARWARERVAELIERRGWRVRPDSAAPAALARLLVYLREIGEEGLIERLDARADIAERTAELDLDAVDARDDLGSKVHAVVVGTVLGDALAATLRRIAQQDASARRYRRQDRG